MDIEDEKLTPEEVIQIRKYIDKERLFREHFPDELPPDEVPKEYTPKFPPIDEVHKKIHETGQIDATKKIVNNFREQMKNWSPDQENDYRKHQGGKNAYEIRSDVLQMAIDWLRLETNQPSNKNGYSDYETFRSGDAVIELAKKFYKFVENKK
jgi:hypothetical protein